MSEPQVTLLKWTEKEKSFTEWQIEIEWQRILQAYLLPDS